MLLLTVSFERPDAKELPYSSVSSGYVGYVVAKPQRTQRASEVQ